MCGGGSFLLIFGEISESESDGERARRLGPAWGKANRTECIQYRFKKQGGAIRPLRYLTVSSLYLYGSDQSSVYEEVSVFSLHSL